MSPRKSEPRIVVSLTDAEVEAIIDGRTYLGMHMDMHPSQRAGYVNAKVRLDRLIVRLEQLKEDRDGQSAADAD